MRSGVTGSVVDVNHKDPFKGGYEIYHPMVAAKPRDLIAQPSFFAATKRAVPSGANVLAVKPVRMGRGASRARRFDQKKIGEVLTWQIMQISGS